MSNHVEDRIKEVKEYFENPSFYLGNSSQNFALKLRSIIVSSMVDKKEYSSLLDLPCGDGSMVIPLLNKIKNACLVDISESMVELAMKNIPDNHKKKVQFINEDVFKIDFQNRKFDLILCLGILAHVPTPLEFIEKMSSLVGDEGTLILQNTDTNHFLIKIRKFLSGKKHLIQKNSYQLNSISHEELMIFLRSNNLKVVSAYRYEASIPFLSRFLDEEKIFTLLKFLFGIPPLNKNSWLGSKCIYRIEKA